MLNPDILTSWLINLNLIKYKIVQFVDKKKNWNLHLAANILNRPFHSSHVGTIYSILPIVANSKSFSR